MKHRCPVASDSEPRAIARGTAPPTHTHEAVQSVKRPCQQQQQQQQGGRAVQLYSCTAALAAPGSGPGQDWPGRCSDRAASGLSTKPGGRLVAPFKLSLCVSCPMDGGTDRRGAQEPCIPCRRTLAVKLAAVWLHCRHGLCM